MNLNLNDDPSKEPIKVCLEKEFNGTLFRFPIRTKEAADVSELSKEHKPIEQIVHDDILNSFYKDFDLILLFLRRIEKIQIYEVKGKNQKLIASTFINFTKSSENLAFLRNEFMKKLNSLVKPDKTMNPDAFKTS